MSARSIDAMFLIEPANLAYFTGDRRSPAISTSSPSRAGAVQPKGKLKAQS
jgi:hypothetical protein